MQMRCATHLHAQRLATGASVLNKVVIYLIFRQNILYKYNIL